MDTISKSQIFSSLRKFQQPKLWLSIWQIVSSCAGFVALICLMLVVYEYSIFLTILLGLPASIFVLRIFIIQHDCGHGAFFKSRKANDAIGWFCSLFTFFPYAYWRHQHALHHASVGKLEERGNGDVFLYTVKEYLALSRWEKFKYRLIRHPITLLCFGPFVMFLTLNRMVYDAKNTPLKVRLSLYFSNILVVAVVAMFVFFLSWGHAASILLPLIFFGGAAGIILFYIQHQFEDTYWEHNKEWDFLHAAIQGSSFFDLPKFLHWCTGNIGYHHIHHLAPKIPNYHLPQCQEAHSYFNTVHKLTLLDGLKTLSLSVWDENQKRLISFKEMKKIYDKKN